MKINRYSFHSRRLLLACACCAPAWLSAPAFADPPSEEPRAAAPAASPSSADTVDKLIERALSTNKEIQAARAKLAEAQLDLDRVQLETSRAIIAARTAIEVQRQQIQGLHDRIVRLRAAVQQGKSPDDVALSDAVSLLRVEEARLPELEAQLEYLLGVPRHTLAAPNWTYTVGPALDPKEVAQRNEVEAIATDPLYARVCHDLVEAETRRFDLYTEDQRLVDVLSILKDGGMIKLVVHKVAFERFMEEEGLSESLLDTKVSLDFTSITFPLALAAVQDQVPWLRFVVRPYGILVTVERGEPLNSITVEEFYRDRSGAGDSLPDEK